MGTTSTKLSRHALLFALLLAACGDDDTSEPAPDASTPADAGGDAGGGDAGLDAGPADAGDGSTPPSDSGMDSGPKTDASSDAGLAGGDAATELEQALVVTGLRYDQRRADLVIRAWCKQALICEPDDAGTTEQDCVDDSLAEFAGNIRDQATAECLDAILDGASCGARISCDEASQCFPIFDAIDAFCGQGADAGNDAAGV